ncbi:MAG: carbohydrate kinase [Clostridia bacterium]|nr:carbohydrate kinase [Clostridia bacterium]
MREYRLLGIDCGLTNVKAVVFDACGNALVSAARHTPPAEKSIDATALWEAACDCIREVCAGHEIAAAGICGHGNGLYALDSDGKVLCALPPMGGAQAEAALSDETEFFRITRQNPWAGQPMQLLRRVKAESEDIYARVACVLHCKDYIRYRLTGDLYTDYSDASASALLDAQKGVYADELFHINGLGAPRGVFPPLLRGYDVAGCVTHKASALTGLKQGTPVAAGLIDLDACRIGAGVTMPGQVSVTAGTWAIATAPTNKLIDARCITQNCFSFDPAARIAVVSAPVSCVNLDWFLARFMPGVSYNEAERIASDAAKEQSVIYLPYLYRDMARPKREAAFIGMTPDTTAAQMLRAVYEGVLFAHMDQLRRLKKAGVPASSVRLSGGAAHSAFWRQLFADGFGLPVETTHEAQVGALGAAIMAACACNIYPNVSDAAAHMVKPEQATLPRGADLFETQFSRFMELAGEV